MLVCAKFKSLFFYCAGHYQGCQIGRLFVQLWLKIDLTITTILHTCILQVFSILCSLKCSMQIMLTKAHFFMKIILNDKSSAILRGNRSGHQRCAGKLYLPWDLGHASDAIGQILPLIPGNPCYYCVTYITLLTSTQLNPS